MKRKVVAAILTMAMAAAMPTKPVIIRVNIQQSTYFPTIFLQDHQSDVPVPDMLKWHPPNGPA